MTNRNDRDDRQRDGQDQGFYGARDARDRPDPYVQDASGQYGNGRDTGYNAGRGYNEMERDMRDSSEYNRDHNNRPMSNADRGYGRDNRERYEQGGYVYGSGFGDIGAGGRTLDPRGAGNSYQRGLGGLSGNTDQDRYGSGWRDGGQGASDRDMGNLERDPYGRGSAARDGTYRGGGGMSGSRGYGSNSDRDMGSRNMNNRDMSNRDMGDRGVTITPVGQHYGRGPRGYARSDERITEEVNEQLTYHHDVDATDIEVQVQGGEVTLTGNVPDRRQKRMAEDVAESVRGVKDVHNQLRVGQSGANQTSANPASGQGDTLVAAPDAENDDR